MERTAVVIDNGSTTIKAGYSGFDSPTFFTHPYYAIDLDHGAQYSPFAHPTLGKTTSAGLEDTPALGVQSVQANEDLRLPQRHLYHNELDPYSPTKTIYSAISHGLVTDFDQMENIWLNIYRNLHADPTEQPVLLSEAIYNTKARRGKTLEIFFEQLLVPQLGLQADAALSLFSTGRSTGCVVDMGGGHTTIASISEGHVIFNAARYTKTGGDMVDAMLLRLMQHSHDIKQILLPYQLDKQMFQHKHNILFSQRSTIPPPPDGATEEERLAHIAAMQKKREQEQREHQAPIALALPPSTPSYYNYQLRKLIHDIKLHTLTIPITPLNPIAAKDVLKDYVLPDGQVIHMGEAGCVAGESLFQPTYQLGQMVTTLGGDLHEKYQFSALPIDIFNCIQSTDVDLRVSLLNNILLCGGASLPAGLTQRVQLEVGSLFPAGFKVELLKTLTNNHKHFATWLGGALLSSLSSYQSEWLFKTDYEEHGDNLLLRM